MAQHSKAFIGLVALAATVLLSACGEGSGESESVASTALPVGAPPANGYDQAVTLPANGSGQVVAPPSTVPVATYPGTSGSVPTVPGSSAPVSTPAVPGNVAPTIGGTAPASVSVGQAFNFQPSASDANGDALGFSISGKPSWMAFETSTGRLTGTPTGAQVGTYANITITVNDGSASKSLAPFSINVTQISTGSATLSWTPPTTNTDGSSLANLAGYKIYYGSSATALTQTIQITNPGLTTYVVSNLGPGTTYFAIAAYSSTGVESQQSAVGSKTI